MMIVKRKAYVGGKTLPRTFYSFVEGRLDFTPLEENGVNPCLRSATRFPR